MREQKIRIAGCTEIGHLDILRPDPGLRQHRFVRSPEIEQELPVPLFDEELLPEKPCDILSDLIRLLTDRRSDPAQEILRSCPVRFLHGTDRMRAHLVCRPLPAGVRKSDRPVPGIRKIERNTVRIKC